MTEPKAKRAKARATTDEACAAYVEARRQGMTERAAAAHAGVSRDAVRQHPVYGPAADVAHEEYVESQRQIVDRVSRGEVEDPQQARVMLAAATWTLGKRQREEFGETSKTEMVVTAKQAPPPALPRDAQREELRALQAEVAAALVALEADATPLLGGDDDGR
jgi:hypothetical protein